MKEYYKMSDIVFSNLTTETKDGQLLETGGMIYFDARANNKKVELKENASYTIKFPTKNEKKKENMKLFDGEMSDKTIIWKQQKDENDKVKRRPFRPWQNVGIRKVVKEKDRDKETIRATFKGGREKLIEYLKNTTRYPQKAIDERISGTVYLSFFIDTTGKIITPRIIHDAGVHPMLDEEAIRVVQSMPEWTPEEIFGNKTLTRRTVPIKFALNGTTPVYDYTNDDFIHFSDSVNAKRRKAYGKRWINEDGSFKDFINDTSLALQDLSHYALSGSKLGWINCDRFTRMRGEKINLSIKLDSKYASVKLIFHDIKSVMQGSNRTGYSRFKNLPKGKKASVFAIQYRDKKPFVCFKEITITNNYIRLDFEELTKSKLAEYTDRINNI